MSRSHCAEHEVSCLAQLPLWQVNALQVQAAGGADSSHGPENAQLLHDWVLVAQVVPLVLRVQAVVHDAAVGMHTSF